MEEFSNKEMLKSLIGDRVLLFQDNGICYRDLMVSCATRSRTNLSDFFGRVRAGRIDLSYSW